jgi:hypothetical protein
MELDLDGERVPLHVQRASSVRSPHTGAPLAEIHGLASTRETPRHQRWTQLLRDAEHRVVRSARDTDGSVGKWHVSWNSYAESGGEHRYTLILREKEELSLDCLTVGGVELRPYEYRETFSGGELTIRAKLVGTKPELLRLRALLKTRARFPVVRRGINDEPRPMRFGVAEWSEHDGQIKARVILVDADADPAGHPDLVRIEEANQRSAVAFYVNFVERLADLLQEQGLLAAEQIEAARTAAREDPWRARHEFWRVPDVDLL